MRRSADVPPISRCISTKGRGHRDWLRTCSEPGMKGKGRLMTSRHSILVFSLALLTTFLAANLRGGAQNDALDLVDAKGNIRKPADYRDRYHALGVYTVLDPKGNEMHYTYASPGTAEFYRQNNRFADGTVLVKDVLATSHTRLTTGDAH